MRELNGTHTELPLDRGVHALIAAQAARTPDAVALVSADRVLTYSALDARANQLARHLRSVGVGAETLVGLCVDRSAEMVIALLGILKAGGAYLPLDPAYPPDRLAWMVHDAGVDVLLTQDRWAPLFPPDLVAPLVCLDRDRAHIARAPAHNLKSDATSRRLAYVIYTSGSSGRPKGVEVEHGSLAAFLAAMTRELGLTAEDTLAAVTTLSFDIAGLELYLPLVVGGRIAIVDRETAADGKALSDFLTSSAATAMQATPATWRLLLAAGWTGERGFRVFCGGEELPRELARALVQRSTVVWNLYGPTETTIWSARHPVEGGNGPVPIGRPIAGTRMHVVDTTLQAVPSGEVGEIVIGGAGVARGYRRRPDLVADRFIPDPFGSSAGARVYRTGDRGRRSADGTFEFLGRGDRQTKLRGFRIEPGEIEHALVACDGVAHAAVVVREDRPTERRLVAFVVPAPGTHVATETLRAQLLARLPEYMVPASFIALGALPLTPSGKIDRTALLASGALQAEMAPYAAPRTPTEELLAAIWADVLHVGRVGIHDSFFALGGHSLLGTLIATRIAQARSCSLSLRDVISHPTVERLAVFVDQHAATPPRSRAGTGAIQRLPRHGGGSRRGSALAEGRTHE